MAHLVVQGKIELTKFNECYQSWKAHAAFGDCEGIISNLDKQINEILGVNIKCITSTKREAERPIKEGIQTLIHL